MGIGRFGDWSGEIRMVWYSGERKKGRDVSEGSSSRSMERNEIVFCGIYIRKNTCGSVE